MNGKSSVQIQREITICIVQLVVVAYSKPTFLSCCTGALVKLFLSGFSYINHKTCHNCCWRMI